MFSGGLLDLELVRVDTYRYQTLLSPFDIWLTLFPDMRSLGTRHIAL